ncbi:hypothetical protein IFR05_006354 [Cadophora sp. M221]|nr:hypothetical protein IFR05_006354 [Cadophora sp. M221]
MGYFTYYCSIAILAVVAVAFFTNASRTGQTTHDLSASSPSTAAPESVTPVLRSCFRSSTLPSKKSVRFITLDTDVDSDLVSVCYYDVSSDSPSSLKPVSPKSCGPRTPGAKCGLVYPDASIKMVKRLGEYLPPTHTSAHRPRCGNLRRDNECFDCRRDPVERNTWLRDIRPAVAVTLSARQPVFQVPARIRTSDGMNRSRQIRVVFTHLVHPSIPIPDSPKRGQSQLKVKVTVTVKSPPPHPRIPDILINDKDSGSSREGNALFFMSDNPSSYYDTSSPTSRLTPPPSPTHHGFDDLLLPRRLRHPPHYLTTTPS